MITEKKLAKIRRDPDVVKQLSAKREQCMIELLENTDTLQYSTFEEPIDNSHSFIYRSFYPQRVAIKRGEIIGLVKNDQFNTSDKDESDWFVEENRRAGHGRIQGHWQGNRYVVVEGVM